MDWDKNGTVSPIEFKSYLANLKKGEVLNSGKMTMEFHPITLYHANLLQTKCIVHLKRLTQTVADKSSGKNSW